jgi:protocatechuate 3,4-dioxygenase beta subunit
MALTRRDFLALGVLAPVTAALARAEQGLGEFTMAGPPCLPDVKPTPAIASPQAFRRGAPLRAWLADPSGSATPLVLNGTVTGVKCGRIKDAEVEVWHPDERGAFDMSGFRYRGRQLTGADGQFTFRTIMPGAPRRRTRHIGLHVRVPNKTELWTELFVPGESANAGDSRFRQELLLKVRPEGQGKVAEFSVLLDL